MGNAVSLFIIFFYSILLDMTDWLQGVNPDSLLWGQSLWLDRLAVRGLLIVSTVGQLPSFLQDLGQMLEMHDLVKTQKFPNTDTLAGCIFMADPLNTWGLLQGSAVCFSGPVSLSTQEIIQTRSTVFLPGMSSHFLYCLVHIVTHCFPS